MSGIEDSPVGAAPNLADRTNRDTGATDNGRHWKAGTQVHGDPDRQAYSDFARALSRACATSVQSPPDDFTSHNPVEDPIEDAGIKLGEVVGWRAWRMSGSSYLRSVMASDNGVYAKARSNDITGQPTIATPGGFGEVAREALQKLGVDWQPAEAERAYNEGRSTQIPVMPVVKVNDRFARRLAYRNVELICER